MFPALIITFIILIIVYFKFKYFTLYGPIPGLSPHFLFGNLIQSGLLLNDTSLCCAHAAFKKRYGDIFQFWFGPARVVVVSGLADVKHIFSHRLIYDQGEYITQRFNILLPDSLISVTGAKFKRHASLILPLLRHGKIVAHFDIIVSCTDKLLANWRLQSRDRIHVDILEQCQNLQLATFGFIAYDYDLKTLQSDRGTDANELAEALQHFMDAFQLTFYAPRIISSLYLQLSRQQRRALATIKQYINGMIEQELTEDSQSAIQRKKTWLIASLVSSLQENENENKREEEKKGLSRHEVLYEMLALMVAATETTAATLAWFIHLMSKYPQIQQKIKAELIEHDAKQDLSLDHLNSLVYLDCVINEVLRFCVPVIGTTRTLTVNDRLPESGVQLFKGDTIYIPFYNLSRDTRQWSIDPDIFYPERFLSENENHESRVFVPFGSGHRQCAGQDLARFQLKLIAARLMQKVTFGDGGPEVNAGGNVMKMVKAPKHVGVTIDFD